MTPCEKLGYKVGDEFEVVGPFGGLEPGDRVTLYKDDGTNVPLFDGEKCTFNNANGKPGAFLSLSWVKPLTITLRPGDYVSSDGITDAEYHAVADAFMGAGAGKGEYPNWGFVTKTSADSFGWLPGGDLYHQLSHEFKRHLTINQVLNATNSPGKTPQQGPKAMGSKDGEKLGVKRTVTIDIAGLNAEPQQEPAPMTTIDTLHEAKRQRDEAAEKLETAEAVLNTALDAVQTELGVGFIIKESGDSDFAERTLERLRTGEETTHSLDDVERELGLDHPAEDMNDPANWRAGDVVEATKYSIDITKWREYVITKIVNDENIFIEDDAGDLGEHCKDQFTFVRRP